MAIAERPTLSDCDGINMDDYKPSFPYLTHDTFFGVVLLRLNKPCLRERYKYFSAYSLG